jgi:hypothetical protein
VKYLRRYSQINETDINSDDFRVISQEIRDILLELEDGGKIEADIETTSGKFKTYIVFYLHDLLDFDGFYFDEISEYVFRIKDYLGDKLKSCSVLLVKDRDNGALLSGYNKARINLDITDEEQTINRLKGLPIENLVIQIK